MKLESLEICGYMPFKDNVYIELPSGPIGIVGKHAGDERRSNRSGKTAFLEAITWAISGVHRKRLDDQIINQQSDVCSVTLAFGDMAIARGRKRGESTKLRVKHGSKEFTGQKAQEAIWQYMGLSLDDYLATQCFRQGDVESIISRTAGERLALVSDWLQQGRWFDAKKIQGTKMNFADAQLATKREKLGMTAAHVLTDGLRLAMVNEVERLRIEMADLERERAELSKQIALTSELAAQAAKARELVELRRQAQQLRATQENPAKAREAFEAAEKAYQAAREERLKIETDLQLVRRVVDDGFDGKCPVMCAECPVADQVTEQVRESHAMREHQQKDWTVASLAVHKCREQMDNAKNAVDAIQYKAWQYKETVRKGRELAAAITENEEELLALEADVAPLQAQQEHLHASYVKKSNRVKEIETMLEASNVMAKKCDALEKEVKEAEIQAQVARLAYRAIANVPSRIASEQLGELEQEANLLLASTGVSLRFSWARELTDKAPVCDECAYAFQSGRQEECPVCKAVRGKKRAQELEILCSDGSVEEDVRYNSGGTRAIVGSAIRLAASAMLRRLRATQAAWAIVDEPFGSLDAENREGLAATFSGMLGSVGFEQALVVSHDPQLLSALPHRIIVDKDGANSTVRIE